MTAIDGQHYYYYIHFLAILINLFQRVLTYLIFK